MRVKTLPVRLSFWLSMRICNLFEDTYAISRPEKKNENESEISMTKKVIKCLFLCIVKHYGSVERGNLVVSKIFVRLQPIAI